MELSHHAITNDYQDARLISLRNWKHAWEFEDRDEGGPYAVSQAGYDPAELGHEFDEFVLGKSGRWVPLAVFFGLPGEIRRAEFIFAKAADVMNLMSSLPGKVQIVRSGKELETEAAGQPGPELKGDDLVRALVEAKDQM